MAKHSEPPINLDAAVTDLTLAVGQLLRRLRQEVDNGGLSWSQISALARLERNGPMTTAELARLEAVKPQSMGATLAELEQQGLIQRQPHPTDGRQVLLSLTEEGIAMRRQRSIDKQQWLLAALARFDPAEQQALIAATALIKRLGEG